MRGSLLTDVRARAIEVFLYQDMREQDAAVAMGLEPDAPVAIWATQGLRQLAAEWETRDLWRRSDDGERQADAAAARSLQGA